MSVCCECCVLLGRGICDGLITHPEESYRMWCVVMCDLETSSKKRRPWPALFCSAIKKGGVCIVGSVFSDTLYNNGFMKGNFMTFSWLNSKMISNYVVCFYKLYELRVKF